MALCSSNLCCARVNCALTGVVRLVGHRTAKQKVTGSIPGQGTCLGCGSGPWSRCVCAGQHFSLSLSPSLPLSLKINIFFKKNESTSLGTLCSSFPNLAPPQRGGNKSPWPGPELASPPTLLCFATFGSHPVLLTLGFKGTLITVGKLSSATLLLRITLPSPRERRTSHAFILLEVALFALFMSASLFS